MEFEKWTYSACGISESAATRGSNTITANNWPQFQHISNWRLLEAMAGSLTVLPSSSFWGPPQKKFRPQFSSARFSSGQPQRLKGPQLKHLQPMRSRVTHTQSFRTHSHTHTRAKKARDRSHLGFLFVCARVTSPTRAAASINYAFH